MDTVNDRLIWVAVWSFFVRQAGPEASSLRGASDEAIQFLGTELDRFAFHRTVTMEAQAFRW